MENEKGVTNQYRDWLIPATLLTAVSASILLFILNIVKLDAVLIISATFSIISIFLFMLCLLYVVTKLEAIECMKKDAVRDDGLLFVFPTLGMLTFCISLSTLCFWKSKILGSIVIGLIILAFIALIRILKDEDKMK